MSAAIFVVAVLLILFLFLMRLSLGGKKEGGGQGTYDKTSEEEYKELTKKVRESVDRHGYNKRR